MGTHFPPSLGCQGSHPRHSQLIPGRVWGCPARWGALGTAGRYPQVFLLCPPNSRCQSTGTDWSYWEGLPGADLMAQEGHSHPHAGHTGAQGDWGGCRGTYRPVPGRWRRGRAGPGARGAAKSSAFSGGGWQRAGARPDPAPRDGLLSHAAAGAERRRCSLHPGANEQLLLGSRGQVPPSTMATWLL